MGEMGGEQDKKLWRRRERERLIAARLAVAPEERRLWCAAIERNLAELLATLPGRTIGAYWPVKGEFDPLALADRLVAQGCTVALPAVVDRKDPLEYRRWRRGMEMEAGRHDIPAPKARDIVRPDILLVPLVGFDAANYRLGYGGGYFDRTIASLTPRPVTIGIGFEAALLPTIFPHADDVALDVIVSEAQTRHKPRHDQG